MDKKERERDSQKQKRRYAKHSSITPSRRNATKTNAKHHGQRSRPAGNPRHRQQLLLFFFFFSLSFLYSFLSPSFLFLLPPSHAKPPTPSPSPNASKQGFSEQAYSLFATPVDSRGTPGDPRSTPGAPKGSLGGRVWPVHILEDNNFSARFNNHNFSCLATCHRNKQTTCCEEC